jgi:hypothetical protein
LFVSNTKEGLSLPRGIEIISGDKVTILSVFARKREENEAIS